MHECGGGWGIRVVVRESYLLVVHEKGGINWDSYICVLCDSDLIQKQCVKGRYTTKVVVVVVMVNHHNQSQLWLLLVFLQILVVVIDGGVGFLNHNTLLV
jgi:hypothetical protein